VLGELDGLVHGLAEIGEGGGGFGLEVTLCDGRENAAHGGAEIAGGEVIAEKERRYGFPGLFGGLGLRFLLGVEVAEVQVAGAARGAALAAIGKGKSTQTGTVLFTGGRKTVLFMCGRKTANLRLGRRTVVFLCGRRADFFLCGRRTANGAVRGHRSSPEKLDLSCKGSLAEGEAHFFTALIYQSSDRVVKGDLEKKLRRKVPTLKKPRVGRPASQK
jgi:hypothetical protein